MQQRGFTLIELMIVIAIIAIIAAIAIPGLLSSQRASNERNASTSLKTVTSAEADFRANDRDWNRLNDFWTGDLKGLYTMTSAATPGSSNATTDPAIKLIELSLALADAQGGIMLAGGENCSLTSFGLSSPKAGYWYHGLILDAGVPGPDGIYRQDTGGSPTMGNVHNFSRFAFMAWPDTSSAGKYVFLVDENNTIFRTATSGTVKPSMATPPGIPASPYNIYPTAGSLKSYWTKLD